MMALVFDLFLFACLFILCLSGQKWRRAIPLHIFFRLQYIWSQLTVSCHGLFLQITFKKCLTAILLNVIVLGKNMDERSIKIVLFPPNFGFRDLLQVAIIIIISTEGKIKIVAQLSFLHFKMTSWLRFFKQQHFKNLRCDFSRNL